MSDTMRIVTTADVRRGSQVVIGDVLRLVTDVRLVPGNDDLIWFAGAGWTRTRFTDAPIQARQFDDVLTLCGLLWSTSTLPDGVTATFEDVEHFTGALHRVATLDGCTDPDVDFACLTCGVQGDTIGLCDGDRHPTGWHQLRAS
jgi:hypothetical protein